MSDSNEEPRYDLIPPADKSKGKKVWLTKDGVVDATPKSNIETDLDRVRKREVIDVFTRDTGNNGPSI